MILMLLMTMMKRTTSWVKNYKERGCCGLSLYLKRRLFSVKNVSLDVKNNILTITIDLSKTFGRSKSGKTEIIATTSGNVSVPNTDAKIGLNVYR